MVGREWPGGHRLLPEATKRMINLLKVEGRQRGSRLVTGLVIEIEMERSVERAGQRKIEIALLPKAVRKHGRARRPKHSPSPIRDGRLREAVPAASRRWRLEVTTLSA